MKKIYRVLIPVIILFVAISVMPFNHIFADQTYYYFEPNGVYIFDLYRYQTTFPTDSYSYDIKSPSNSRCVNVIRYANLNSGRQDYNIACVIESDSEISFAKFKENNGSETNFNYLSTYIYESTSYAINMFRPAAVYNNYTVTSDYGFYLTDNTMSVGGTNLSNNDFKRLLVRLTFGDLAQEQGPPPPVYGLLKTGYSTKFVSENFVGVDSHNIDTITWEETDTNGNFLMSPGSMVEIRAVPGYFEAPSEVALASQTITNFIKGLWAKSPLPNSVVDIQPVEYYTIGRFSPNKKSVEIMWKDVVDTFWYDSEQPFLGSLYSEVWYKIGWRYEIRFYVGEYEDPDYISEWQTIYQITSVDVQTSNNVIQQAPQGLTPELYNLLQTVNTLNNTVQNWNINGVPIQMDPQNTPSQDNSWIEKLIESIASMFGSLINAIGDIVQAILGLGSDIINGIFNLINNLGVNILDTFTNLWNNFINLFNGINFTDENPEFDIDFNLEDGDSPLDVVPAFVRMIYSSGLGYILWMPLIVGIIFMIV